MRLPPFARFCEILLNTLEEKCRARGTSNLVRSEVLGRVRDKLSRLERSDAADDWLDLAGYAAIGWLMHHRLWRLEPTAYVAHPIDHILWPDLNGYLAQAEVLGEGLKGLGYKVYWPAGAWKAENGGGVVREINERALRACNLLVVLWDPKHPTIGVITEILIARDEGIPVWTISPPSALLSSLVTRCFAGEDDLLAALKEGQT